MAHIVPMILEAMKNHLEFNLITSIPNSDPYRVGLVKVGRFQEDPTKVSTYIAIQPGDPDDPAFKDGIVSISSMEDISMNIPAREIGGGDLWWRRFTCTIGCYWINDRLEEEDAINSSYMVMGRLCNVLPLINLSGLEDEFGEVAQYFPFLYATTFFQGGGENKYIWRGKVLWQVLTSRP